jgi:fucose 4-O-acetylase-like acetyltransferase
MAKRDTAIETLRGLAVILMVSGHVVGSTGNVGMEVADDSWWRHFYLALSPYRMPLFTTISGFVYALRPITWNTAGEFATGKVRRLVLPLLCVSTIVFFASWAMGRGMPFSFSHFYKIYYRPFDLFWFLQAIILIFIYVSVAELFDLMKSRAGWAMSLVAVSIAYLTLPRTTLFSFHSSLYLLPFFVLGLGLQRFGDAFRGWPVRFALGVGFSATFVLFLQRNAFGWQPDLYSERLMFLVAGLSGCALLFQPRFEVRWLAKMGAFAYSIYLLHILFVAGSRIALRRITGDAIPDLVLFPICLALGLAVPILIERSVQHLPWVKLLILGQRSRPVALPVPASPPQAA